jgi:hypothetical protein
MSTEHRSLVDRYIAVWNLPDAHRRAAMSGLFTADVAYVDPLVSTRGQDQLADYIANTVRHFDGMRFAARGALDGHHDQILFGWECGRPGADPAVRGLDVALLEGGLIRAVHGFFH